MSMVNNIGGATLSAAVVAEKSLEPKLIAKPADTSTNADLGASVAAYLSLPGFNSPSTLQNDTSGVSNEDRASAVVKAVAESDDDSLKLALKQFDDGLKRLVERPETQIFQAKFGLESGATGVNSVNSTSNVDLPTPEPLPGVGEDGLLASVSKEEFGADTNKDGKISEDERRRYQLPITYRSTGAVESLVDGPSVFSLTEVNRAYGVVATAEMV